MPSLDVTAPQKVSSTFFVLPSFPPLHTAVGAKKNLPPGRGGAPAGGGGERPPPPIKKGSGMGPRLPARRGGFSRQFCQPLIHHRKHAQERKR